MVKTCLKLIENILTWPFPECLNWMPFWTYENISHVRKQNLEFKAQMDRIIIIFLCIQEKKYNRQYLCRHRRPHNKCKMTNYIKRN